MYYLLMIGELVELTPVDIPECASLLHRLAGSGDESVLFGSVDSAGAYLRWHWENPCHTPDVPVGIGVRRGSNLGGVMLVCPVPFDVSGKKQLFLLAQDFFVAPDYRPGGLGIWTRFRNLRTNYQLYATTANDLSRAIWKRSGAKPIFAQLPQMALTMRRKGGLCHTAVPDFEGRIVEISDAQHIPRRLQTTGEKVVSLDFDIEYLKWKSSGPAHNPIRYWGVTAEETECVIATQIDPRIYTSRILDIMHLWGRFDPTQSAALFGELWRRHADFADTVVARLSLRAVFDEQQSRGLIECPDIGFCEDYLFIGNDDILTKLRLTPLGCE